MSFIKRAEHRAGHFILRYPKALILIAAVLFMMLFIGLESLRAQIFDAQLRNYKESSEVQVLNNTVERLASRAETGGDAALCELKLEGNIQGSNSAYKKGGEEDLQVLMADVNARASEAVPYPAFHSMLRILPHIKARSEDSQNLSASIKSAQNLTKQDTKSSYCLQLLDVLSEVYFLESIRKPEGVAALRVGQVENFQVNVRKAQELLKGINSPTAFLDENTAVSEILNRLALNLRDDENNYEMFSRRIEIQTVELQLVLDSLASKSADLRDLPQRLYLETASLR